MSAYDGQLNRSTQYFISGAKDEAYYDDQAFRRGFTAAEKMATPS
jgi:hypothetical protein